MDWTIVRPPRVPDPPLWQHWLKCKGWFNNTDVWMMDEWDRAVPWEIVGAVMSNIQFTVVNKSTVE